MKTCVRAIFVACALAAAAFAAGCNRPGSAQPQTWAHQLAATYYETRGDGAAVARMARTQDVETALTNLRQALGSERSDRIGAERVGFLLEYPPIWRADHLDQAQWDARRMRIPLLQEADIGQWRASLATATGAQPSEMWTIGYLIDTPTLFKNSAFDSTRSSLLLERLQKLSPEAPGLIASALHIDKPWAAMLIVQNDDLFHNGDIDPNKFAAAVAALDNVTSPPTAATTATTTTTTSTTTSQPSGT